MLIRRPEGGGTLLTRWDGDSLPDDAQFLCGPTERVLVVDLDDEELASFGPGRHALPPGLRGRDEPVNVFFVSTAPVRVHAQGTLEFHDDEPWVEIDATVTVNDPSMLLGLVSHLDEESGEQYVAEDLLRAAGTTAEDNGWGLDALLEASESFAAAIEGEATDALEMFGLAVSVERVQVSASAPRG
ncbi:MAG: hypothetical protein ACOZQL_19305 [Myxococcota bacterium]